MLSYGQRKNLSLNSAADLIDDLKKKINNLLENLKQITTENRELVKENSQLVKESETLENANITLNNQLRNNIIEMEKHKKNIENYMSSYESIKPNLATNRAMLEARVIAVKEDVEDHIKNISNLEYKGIKMIPNPYIYFGHD